MSKYHEYAEKPRDFLALCGYTRQEFDALVPHFSEYYYDWMDTYCLDGKLRVKRKYADYENSPLPTIEDKLFFILSYVKTNNLQTVQGALFWYESAKGQSVDSLAFIPY